MTSQDHPEWIRALSDEEYVALLVRSLESRSVDGVTFPGFPPDVTQSNFVGSSGKHALKEADDFWRFLKTTSARLGQPMSRSSNVLDFGCGWGRFLRFLAKDVDVGHLAGVDVDPEVLAECRALGVPGDLKQIEPLGPLPFPDAHFDIVMAYSVFTHLPPEVNLHWMREIARTCRPNAVFVVTLEPKRFLEFVRRGGTSPWQRALGRFAGQVDDFERRFDRGEFVYIPTGGGDYRPATSYGEAVIPKRWIDREWGDLWKIHTIVDDPNRFPQSVLVVQRSMPRKQRMIARFLARRR